MEPWLVERGAEISSTRFFVPHKLPSLEGIDLVIVMGGPMSVNDEADLPWLMEEKRFVRDAISSGVAVLGVCLGAQLIASVMGSRVYANPQKEIGWFEIESVLPEGATRSEVFRFPDVATVFHWHGETFDLPPGATRLARSTACENQAFQLGRNVIGLQFHLETTPASMNAITTACRDELAPDAFVQSEECIRSVSPETFGQMHELMGAVLDHLLAARMA